MRSISPIELLAVSFAGCAALASTYQSYVAHRGLELARLSNLQSKQIEVCLEFLTKANKVMSTLVVWSRVARKDPGFNYKIISEDNNKLKMRALDASIAFFPTFIPLALLAGKEVVMASEQLNESMAISTELLSQDVPSKVSVDTWVTQFNSALGTVDRRCREVVSGVRGGDL